MVIDYGFTWELGEIGGGWGEGGCCYTLSSSIVPPCVITYGVNIAFRVHLLQKSACRL